MLNLNFGLKSEPTLAYSLQRRIRTDFLSNWRLALLGLTGVVLSVASGWTTYDGMTNFTRSPILSLMITFGIQGVMLVTAWLIGESFATGATGEESSRKQGLTTVGEIAKKALQLFAGMLALFAAAFLIATYILAIDLNEFKQVVAQNAYEILIILGAILALALILVLFSRAEIIGPYARGMRVILAHVPLWLMFLSCMATSVFFSFDSLFSSIFPPEERKRAGDLRAQGQIAGMIADIDSRIRFRRDEASEALLASEAWRAYETNIGQLIGVVRAAPGAIEQQIVAKLKERQMSLAKEQESLSSARSQQSNLTVEKEQLKVSLERLENEKPQLESEVSRIKNDLRKNRQEVASRKAAAEAEAKGVGETGQVGRGPIYRELNKAVTKLDIEAAAIKSQLKTARDALEALDKRRAKERARLVEIETELARLKSQQLAAEEGIKVQEALGQSGPQANIDSSGGLKSLEQELAKFRQEPTRQTLTNIQQACDDLLRTVNEVPKLKAQTSGMDCEPGQANDLAGKIFALNATLTQYQSKCGKEAKVLPSSTDELLSFGRNCIQISGLPAADTEAHRIALNRIALNRDDKAHRFVVTWNAFADGNRLAYLALAIAIAIDGLVFMSGLFGAAAIRSPLSDSPHARNRPISHLEEIIDNALLPDKVHAVEQVLNVMHPLHDSDGSGYMARIDLNELVGERKLLVRKILTAGASLGLIKHDEDNASTYYVRSELFEYLSSVRAREFKLGNVGRPQDVQIVLEAAQEPAQVESLQSENVGQVRQKRLSSHEVKQDHLIEYNKSVDGNFDKAYLADLDLPEAALEYIRENQEDWETSLQRLGEHGSEISHLIAHTKARIENTIKGTRERLNRKYRSEGKPIDEIEEHAETFKKWIPGIVVMKSYERSKMQADALRKSYEDLEVRLQSADEDVVREINKTVSEMDEAEQENVAGWFELELASNKLEKLLKQI